MKKEQIFNIAKNQVGKMGVPIDSDTQRAQLRKLKTSKRKKRS